VKSEINRGGRGGHGGSGAKGWRCGNAQEELGPGPMASQQLFLNVKILFVIKIATYTN
jgi:hypothetical protein